LNQRINADSFIIADSEETFVYHIIPSDFKGSGSIWVAQRVEDDHFTVVPNVFTIREIDFNDHHKFL